MARLFTRCGATFYKTMAQMQIQLAELLPSTEDRALFDEVRLILDGLPGTADVTAVSAAFGSVNRTYRGSRPGYGACNTAYHDLRHVYDVFLATARLIHGAVYTGEPIGARDTELALFAALLHDVGFMQTSDDSGGTGSKYIAEHVDRSAAFVERQRDEFGLNDGEPV